MKSILSAVCVPFALLTAWPAASDGQNFWTGGADTSWTNENNWLDFSPPLAGESVTFDANAAANQATQLGADFSLGALLVEDVPAAISISGFALSLGAGGLDLGAAEQNLTINSRVVLATGQTWGVAAGRQAQVAGRLEGSADLLTRGAGTVAFSGNGSANVFSGNVTVVEGMLLFNGAANQPPLGTRPPRTVTVLSNATLTANNGVHNPLGTEANGMLSLVLSNGVFNVPAYCHLSNLTMWAGSIAPNGAMSDGLDLRSGTRVATRASDNPATISAKYTVRGPTVVDVEDGAAAVDLVLSGNAAGNSQLLVKTNAGTLEISGAADNVSLGLLNDQGKTVLAKASSASVHALGFSLVLNDGEVELGGTGGDQIHLGATTVIGGGLLDLNGRSEGINGLAGPGGAIRNDAAGLSTLTIGQNNGSASYAGTITDGVGPVALVKAGTGTQLLTGTNTISGGVSVTGGTLQVDGQLNGSVVTVGPGAALLGTGTVGGSVALVAGGRLSGGGAGGIGTLRIVSNLTGSVGATNGFHLTASTNIGSGVNDLIEVGGDLDPQGLGMLPAIVGVPPPAGYRLINYSGSLLSGFTLLVTNAGRYGLAVDTTVVNQVNLLVSGTNRNLRWDSAASEVWDQNTTANWYDLDAAAPGSTFVDLDTVLFDDTPGVTTTVAVTGTLQPAAVTVASDTNAFTLSGGGKLSGPGGLVKRGASTLVVTNTGGNDFTGPVMVSGGVFRVGVNAALGKSSGVTVDSGGRVDLNGVSQAGQAYAYAIAGAGPDGLGAIYNAGADIGANSGITSLTLVADAAVGAYGPGVGGTSAGRTDIGLGGALNGGGFTLTKLGAAPLNLRGAATGFAAIIVSNGVLVSENVNDSWGTNLVVESAGRLGMFAGRTTTASILMRGGTLSTWGSTASTYAGPIVLASNSILDTETRISGYGASEIFVSGSMSGPGSLTKLGAQTAHLSGTNSFTGELTIPNGGGQINLSSAGGPAVAGQLVLGHGAVNGGTAVLRTYRNNQFGPGVVVTNRGSWGDWTYLVLMGTTQTVAGLNDETGAGVLEATESDDGIASDSLLIFNGSGTYSCNSFTRDRSGGTSTSKLRILMTGSGTQTLAGSNRSGPPDFSGGIIVSNGWINLKSHRAAGSGTIELAGGGLALDGSGLAEDRSPANNWDTAFTNDAETVVHYPGFAGDPTDGDAAGPTWIYTGYFNVTNPAPVAWTFAEQYDDDAYLKVDGQVLLNNSQWNQPTIATVTLQPGLHEIEFRVHSTDAGIGPNNGWTNGIGYDAQGRAAATPTNFVPFVDPGDGSFLQTHVRVTNAIAVRANARLKVSSAWGPTNIIASALTESGGSYGLTKVGAGALLLTAPTQALTGPIAVEAGKLLVLGDITSAGIVTAKTGAVIGGSATAGSLVVEHLGGVQPFDPAPGENPLVFNTAQLGTGVDSTTRVCATLGMWTNILEVTEAGGLTVNGKVFIDINMWGVTNAGVFDVIRYSGTLNGSLSNFELGTLDFNPLRGPVFLQNSNSAIQVVIPAGSTLFWSGTPVNHWNAGGFFNWVGYAGGEGLQYIEGEPVTFNDIAANFTVDLADMNVAPSYVTVSAETNDYTITGAFSITGSCALAKSGAGTLSIANAHGFTGPLLLRGGVVSVAMLANAGLASPIGAQSADAANLFIEGGTLRYTGPGTTINRMFTIGPTGGVLEVSEAASTLTFNGGGWIIDGTLTKRGPGRIAFAGYSGSGVGAALALLVEGGSASFNSGYFAGTPVGPLQVRVTTNGALRIGAAHALGGSNLNGGSWDVITLDGGTLQVDSEQYMRDAGVGGAAVLVLANGGRTQGGSDLRAPDGGVRILSQASALTNRIGTTLNAAYNSFNLDVEDGTAQGDLEVSGHMGGGGGYTKSGAGTLLQSGTANFGGAWTVQSGTWQVGDGGTAGTLYNGKALALDGRLVIRASDNEAQNAAISGTGTVIQAGTGRTDLGGANTYSGPTLIDSGTLWVNGSLAAESAVTVAPAGRLGGIGVASGTVALAGTVAPGWNVGRLTTGSETWAGGAVYRLDVSDLLGTFGAQPGWDRLQVEGGLTINASAASQLIVRVTSVNEAGGSAIPANLAAHTSYVIPLARVTGAIAGFDAAAFAVDLAGFISPYAVTNVQVQVTGTDVELVLQTGAAFGALVWDADAAQGAAQDGSGTWDLSNTNWLSGTTNVPWVQTAAAVVGADTNSGGSYTLTLGAASLQATALLFPTGSIYTIAGTNTLAVLGGDITVSASAATVSAVLGGGGFAKRGAGALTLSRAAAPANSYAGKITVAEGTLLASGFGSDAVIRGDLDVGPGAVFQLQSSHIVANTCALQVNAGGMADFGAQSEVIGNLTGGGTVSGSGGQIDLDYLASGGNYVFWGTIAGSKGLFLNNDQVRGGTQWLNGTSALSFLAMEGPDILRLSSNGVTAISGTLAVNTGGGYDGAVVIVEEGHSLTASRIETQNAANHNAQFYQNGGRVTVTDATSEEGPLRVGHFSGNEDSTYWMNGGVLAITNAGAYGKLTLGVEGYGFFNQSGGTAMVKQLSLNERGGAGGGYFTLSNGVFSVGSAGITTEGGDYRLTFAGGTLSAWDSYTIAVTSLLSGAVGDLRVDPQGYTITWSGPVSGAGGLLVDGTGTVVMAGVSPYGGHTTISAGQFRANGALSGTIVDVEPAGTLSGTGSIGGSVTALGAVAPGAGAVGTLTLGNGFTAGTGAVLAIELEFGASDLLAVAGVATIDGALSVTNLGLTPAFGGVYTVLTATVLSGTFASTNLPALDVTNAWLVAYTNNSVVLSVVPGGPPPTPYELWAQGSITNPALRGDQEDADGDGDPNLWEYSQGSDPTNGAGSVKALLVPTNGVFAIKFNRVTSAVDIAYFVEASYGFADDAAWECISSNYLGAGWNGDATAFETNSGPVLQVFVEDNDPLAVQRGLRLRIERP